MIRKTILLGETQHEQLKQLAREKGFPNLNEFIRYVLTTALEKQAQINAETVEEAERIESATKRAAEGHQ
jgi:Arc/MetJ-type ribon-helix-helix transcriptional regulator